MNAGLEVDQLGMEQLCRDAGAAKLRKLGLLYFVNYTDSSHGGQAKRTREEDSGGTGHVMP